MRDQGLAVRRHDARRLLPPVLQRVEATDRRASAASGCPYTPTTPHSSWNLSVHRSRARSLAEPRPGVHGAASAADAALERPAPALARRLDREIDEVVDHEAVPAHLAEHRAAARRRAAPARAAGRDCGGAATPACATGSRRTAARRRRDAALEGDACARAAGRRSSTPPAPPRGRPRPRRAPSAAAARAPPSSTRRCSRFSASRSIHGGAPRAGAVDDGEILAAAQLLARAPEQHDDVALGLPPRRQHASRRRRAGPPSRSPGVGGMFCPSVSL